MEMKYSAGWRIDSRWLEEERTYGRKWTKKESKYAPMHVLIVLLMEGNEWRKKITKAILAWKKERFNGYLDGMKAMFRRESPDDAWLTWMIEALRAGELSSHVGRVLERKKKGRKRKRGPLRKKVIFWKKVAAAPGKRGIFALRKKEQGVPSRGERGDSHLHVWLGKRGDD